MQPSADAPAATPPLTFEKLFDHFESHDAKLETLCRRIECVRPSIDADDRVARLEREADKELDAIVRVALAMSCLSAKQTAHLRMKAHVLWSLIGDEEPQSIAEVLIRSLCGDLLDT